MNEDFLKGAVPCDAPGGCPSCGKLVSPTDPQCPYCGATADEVAKAPTRLAGGPSKVLLWMLVVAAVIMAVASFVYLLVEF